MNRHVLKRIKQAQDLYKRVQVVMRTCGSCTQYEECNKAVRDQLAPDECFPEIGGCPHYIAKNPH